MYSNGCLISKTLLNPIQGGDERRLQPCQFSTFSSVISPKVGINPLNFDFYFKTFYHTAVKYEGHTYYQSQTELELGPQFKKKKGFSGQILIKLNMVTSLV